MATQTQKNSSNHTEEDISTPDVKKSNGFKIAVFIFLCIVILITITKIINRPKKIDIPRIESTRNGVKTIPSVYNEYHTLKKGEVIRVNIPSGYKCNYYGGGKKYYQQAQNSEKEIWGGGSCPTGKGSPNAAYTDLSYYDEEVIVRCEFIKL